MTLLDLPGGPRVAQMYRKMTDQIGRHPHRREELLLTFVEGAFAALLTGAPRLDREGRPVEEARC